MGLKTNKVLQYETGLLWKSRKSKDYISGVGYWYHYCPVTGERRIGFNYNIVKNGKCPAYTKCYACGAKRPLEKRCEKN